MKSFNLKPAGLLISVPAKRLVRLYYKVSPCPGVRTTPNEIAQNMCRTLASVVFLVVVSLKVLVVRK